MISQGADSGPQQLRALNIASGLFELSSPNRHRRLRISDAQPLTDFDESRADSGLVLALTSWPDSGLLTVARHHNAARHGDGTRKAHQSDSGATPTELV